MVVRSTQIDPRAPGGSGGGRRGPAILACLLVAVSGILSGGILGCATPPPAVTTNQVLTEDEAHQTILLTGSDKAEIRSAFRSFAAGHRPVNPPSKAKGGIDWADAELAVSLAVEDVEATIVTTEAADDGQSFRFVIRTIENFPGEVNIRRVDGPSVYEAQAWIGRFPTEARHVKRAEKIIKGIEKHIKQLGRQKWFREQD